MDAANPRIVRQVAQALARALEASDCNVNEMLSVVFTLLKSTCHAVIDASGEHEPRIRQQLTRHLGQVLLEIAPEGEVRH